MRKHIVILSAFFTPLRSGAEACAEEVARELGDDFDFTVVTARLRRTLPREEMIGKIRVMRIGLGLSLDKWLYPFLASRTACALQPDLIHAVLESFAGEALVRCARRCPSVPRLLTCQSTNTSLRLSVIHRVADRVTAISSTLVERAKKLGHKRVILIPNGIRMAEIDRERRRTEKIPGRILFVGRLEPMKGVDTLLQAFAHVVERGKVDAFLQIVGGGSLEKQLRRMAKSLGCEDRIVFRGFVPVPDVYREFAQASIFCGLSRSEALGNVFLEAQAAGCAVVATKVGGIPDIVHDGETGILVKPDDAGAAADALEQLLEDMQLREHLAKAAVQHVRAYDWGKISEKYRKVYEEMINRSGK